MRGVMFRRAGCDSKRRATAAITRALQTYQIPFANRRYREPNTGYPIASYSNHRRMYQRIPRVLPRETRLPSPSWSQFSLGSDNPPLIG